MLARRFLYVFAALIILVIAAAVAWNLFQDRIMRIAFVPSVAWSPPPGPAPDYARPESWISRPGLADDPAHWRPFPAAPRENKAAIFFVMPTTALGREAWNVPLTPDDETAARQRQFVRSEASVFDDVGDIWSPRYRQAVLGAFMADAGRAPYAAQAIDFAYQDVARAFAAFVAAIPSDMPIILAGHSQGTLHLIRLMREQVAGKPIARRIAAAYLVGWPIPRAELPQLGLPGCATPDQTNCALSWQSFAEPADTRQMTTLRKGDARPMLCVNPVSGSPAIATPASANRGALRADQNFNPTGIAPGRIPARCTSEGWLLIGPPPSGYDRLVFPGNNYHVFDYALFWADIRSDVQRRVAAYR